jgi:uncharacterized membrane protein (UPF0127 family)
VEVANPVLEDQKGLGGKSGLAKNEGMLFVFNSANTHQFWMKGMKFDIKIVWVRGGEVVGVDEASYKTPYKVYKSPGEIDSVLEVGSDTQVRVGDKVEER